MSKRNGKHNTEQHGTTRLLVTSTQARRALARLERDPTPERIARFEHNAGCRIVIAHPQSYLEFKSPVALKRFIRRESQ